MSEQPNIMVIHCHDLGKHLGCYGRGLETPNIDRLATEGVLFTNHFGTAPYCAPSRCSRSTGLYPINHGATGQTTMGFELRNDVKTLPVYMNELGYDTWLLGLQHESVDRGRLGYKHDPSPLIRAMDVTPRVEEFLENYDLSSGPFYADVGFFEVHSTRPLGGYGAGETEDTDKRLKPLFIKPGEQEKYMGKVAVATPNACDPYERLYEPDEVQPLPYLPDRLSFREDIADLNAQVTNVVDVMVGRIMKKLEETGFARNTLVIFTSDHGICMPRAKGTMYDAGVEVSLIMRLPERFQAGQKADALLSNIDLLPTLIELAGGTPPNNIDGRSFLPLLDGRDYKAQDHIFFDNEWHGRYFGQRGVRSGRYKYFRSFNPQGRYIITHRAGRSFRELAADVRMDHYPPIEEFYDLENDPHEQHNLAPARSIHDILGARKDRAYSADPDHEEMLRQMRGILYDRMLAMFDPLLEGPIPHPAYGMLWDETLFPRG